jgi:hypothetical protein
MIKVDKGIEPPHSYVDFKSRGRGRPPVYPFATMEVGDSVLIEGDSKARRKASVVAHSLSQADRRKGRDPRLFTCKVVGKDQTRIWRVA